MKNKKQKFYNKLHEIRKKLRSVLFPTETERKRTEHTKEQQQERYEKYIPHFMAKTYTNIASWFPLCMFIYFMMFGISVTELTEQTNKESEKKYQEVLDKTNDVFVAYKVANEYRETHPVTHDTQMLTAWNYIMTPLNLNRDTPLNWLILLEGTILGLTPTLAMAHRKKIVDKMYAEKWKLITPIDRTDRKIIHDMSRDAPNYFYHLTLSLTGPEKLRKYKKIAPSIIRGYLETHPEDNRAARILKAYTGKTK